MGLFLGNEATLYNNGGHCTLQFVTSDNSFPFVKTTSDHAYQKAFLTATHAALLPGYFSMHKACPGVYVSMQIQPLAGALSVHGQG